MSFVETMLMAGFIMWVWARVCEVWLKVIAKATSLDEKREGRKSE